MLQRDGLVAWVRPLRQSAPSALVLHAMQVHRALIAGQNLRPERRQLAVAEVAKQGDRCLALMRFIRRADLKLATMHQQVRGSQLQLRRVRVEHQGALHQNQEESRRCHIQHDHLAFGNDHAINTLAIVLKVATPNRWF